MAITIPNTIFLDMLKASQAEAPLEACGYLGGQEELVTSFYPMQNMDASEDHFTLDPKEQFKVIRSAREKNEHILAVYHSHPASPARPSAEDIKLAYDTGMIYLILSLKDGNNTLKGFNINNSEVKELEVIIKR